MDDPVNIAADLLCITPEFGCEQSGYVRCMIRRTSVAPEANRLWSSSIRRNRKHARGTPSAFDGRREAALLRHPITG
jgi:hypothetical protein